MRGGGEEGVERRRRDSLTHTAQDGRGSSRSCSRAPGRFPRGSERGGPASAPGAGLGGQVGPGTLGVPGRRRAVSRAAVRGCRRAEGNGAGLRSRARASSLAGRTRGRPSPRAGRRGEQRPVLRAPVACRRAALRRVSA